MRALVCGEGMSRNRGAETKIRKAFLVYCHICWWSSFRTLMTCKIPFCLAEPNLIVIQLNSNICCYVSANRRKSLWLTRGLGLLSGTSQAFTTFTTEKFGMFHQTSAGIMKFSSANFVIASKMLSSLYDKRIFLFNYVRQWSGKILPFKLWIDICMSKFLKDISRVWE